jgi:hypothetical protein
MKNLSFISKDKKSIKFILYLFSFFIFFFIAYVSLPKLLNFSHESIKNNLKINNDISIDKISDVKYKILPTPRLSIPNSNFTISEGVVEVSNSELEIILNINQILNFKEINYKKLLIKKGSSQINLDKLNQLLKSINKSSRKLTLNKNNLIFIQKGKFFFEINDALIKVGNDSNSFFLNINGKFLNNKIFLNLDKTLKNKNNLTLKIPKLGVDAKVFFEKNNFYNTSGSSNLKVFNNLLKFNFTKDVNIELKDGFIRSKPINTSLRGEVTLKPNFYTKLEFEPSNLNIEELFLLLKKIYFSSNTSSISLIKKINGIFSFKSKIEGKIINKNGEVLLENFKLGKNKTLFLNAKIIEFGKKGKIQFNLVKTVKYKRDLSKKIKIIGVLIPSNSKVIIENFFLENKELSAEKIKEYQNDINDKINQNSLSAIFREDKIDKYLRNLF